MNPICVLTGLSVFGTSVNAQKAPTPRMYGRDSSSIGFEAFHDPAGLIESADNDGGLGAVS